MALETSADPFERRNPRGRYRLNQMVIELEPGVKVFDRDGKADPDATPEDLATLLHEYVHYLHNYGTLSGLTMVVLHTKLAAHLSTAPLKGVPYLACAGLHAPRDGSGDLHGFTTSLRRFTRFMGDYDLPLRGGDRFRFVAGEIEYQEAGNIAVLPIKAWRSKGGFEDRAKLAVGFRAVEESVAFELQRLATAHMGGEEPHPPHYPYLTLRKLRDRFCPKASLSSALRLGVLALNAPHSLSFLIKALRQLREHPRRRHRGVIRAMVAPWRNQLVAAPVADLRRSLSVAYASRGALELAAEVMGRTIDSMMGRRRQDPFFEVDAVEAGVDDVTKLIADLLPCEVVQRFDDGGEVMIAVGDASQNPEEEVWARRSMQSHIRFVETHRAPFGFRSTPEVSKAFEDPSVHHCPYYAICDLERRSTSPEVCSSRPWEYARLDSVERCWHAEGIAATFATFAGRPRRSGR